MQYPTENKDAPTNEWLTRVGRKQSDLDRLAATHDGGKSIGLSPFFAQPTGYDEKPRNGHDDIRKVPLTTMNTGGKGYVQVSAHEQQEEKTFGHAR
jgi:hypothetical protein